MTAPVSKRSEPIQDNMKSNVKVVWLALAAALTLWASAFVGIRVSLTQFTPNAIALLRFLVATGALLAAWIVFTPKGQLRGPALRDMPVFTLSGFLVVVLYNLGLNYGERSVSPGVASFIVGQLPIFSMILAALMLGEQISRRGWIGLSVGLVGTAVMLFADHGDHRLNIGSLFVIGAVLAESIYFVLSKPLLKRYSTLELNVFVAVPGTLLMLPFATELAEQLPSANMQSIAVVAYLGIFPAAVAYVFWGYAMTHLSVTITTSSLYALPAITILLSLLLLHEAPSIMGCVGGVISLAGAILANSSRSVAETTRGANDNLARHRAT